MTAPRILIAGITHETNTYCTLPTTAKDFHQRRGKQVLRATGTETTVGGALAACETLRLDVVPSLVAFAQPSGVIERDTYENFKDEILRDISESKPEGIFLDLHGAGVAEGCEDIEGDLCSAIRALIGPEVPMTAVFDLHGNVSQSMADALDGTFACRQYPHIDLHLRATDAIHLIHNLLDSGIKTVSHVESLPMLLPTTTTFVDPGKAMLESLKAYEAHPDIIDVSWFHGFPFTDVPQVGCHIVVTTTGDTTLARETACAAAKTLWDNRESFRPICLSAEQAIARALQASDGPVVINETSDNCGGGTPGDGTHLLRAMLEAKLDKACFGFMVDPEVATQAHEAGVGSNIEISLGGKTDELHGEPLALTAYVKALHDGRLVMQAMMKGAPLHLGKLARLQVGGIDIIVGSRRSQTFDPGVFEAVGINVTDRHIVALKSSNHFRAGFQHLATSIVTADTPGLTTNRVEIFSRSRATRPLWPADKTAAYG